MLTTLINSIPATDDPVPVFPSVQIGFDERGDKQHQILITEPEKPNPVTGLFAVMTYLDARGFIASRRITMKRLSLHWNVPTLFVWCHEVNGIRGFRRNKINHLTTENGEIFLENEFWASIGIDPDAVLKDQVTPEHRRFKRFLEPQIQILVALARGSGKMTRYQISAIVDYVKTEMKDAGIELSSIEEKYLVNYIRLLRPVREDFKKALEILLGGPFNHRLRLKGGRKDNFFYSALAVIDADQGIQDSARQFIYELKAHY